MHNFVVHSNESACRKSGCLGLELRRSSDLTLVQDAVRHIKVFRNFFLYINENYNDCHKQKEKCTFLYIQRRKIMSKRFYIQNPETLQKTRLFLLRFI